MKRVTEDLIKRAKSPWEIFSRDSDLIEQEKEEYLRRFKPQEYKKIENFILQQQVILLYQRGLEELNGSTHFGDHTLTVMDTDGKEYRFTFQHIQEQRIGQTLTTRDHVIFVIHKDYKNLYDNYLAKCNFERHAMKSLWDEVKYYLPNIAKTFETADGDFVIIVKKLHSKVYPMTSILEYFNGRIDPQYVASIMTRLYKSAIYFDLRGFSHNALTVENLWFSPGRFINPGESIQSVEDVRVVGVYGGWFFATNNSTLITGLPNDPITALPAKIKQILPEEVLKFHYGSYKIDMLAIKQIGRELLGDISGKDLRNTPNPFVEWLNSSNVASNAGKEFEAWEKARDSSFGKHEFIEMHLS